MSFAKVEKVNIKKIVIYFIGVAALFGCFFYFYPADIFEAKITEGELFYTIDVQLQAFFDLEKLPDAIYSPKVTDIKPTWKGGALLFICLIGLPGMIVYRLVHGKELKKEKE